MFFIFLKACKRYAFTYALSSYGGLTLILRPINTFNNVVIEEKFTEFDNYLTLFFNAIKEMKRYREKRGY